MANTLHMAKQQQVHALLTLGWSYRRIEAETGVRRETVSRYDARRRANEAKTFIVSASGATTCTEEAAPPGDANAATPTVGSPANAATPIAGSATAARPRYAAAPYRAAITEKLDAGLSMQRIWQDLTDEFGYGASYQSVKRFVHTLAPRRRAVGVFHCAPGAEAQVDFFTLENEPR